VAVRISDIAARVGVAKATVSLVLNKKRSQVRISRETERKIFETAKEMNYSPSFTARALARGKTRSIGILVNSINNNFYAEFFKYLNDACYKSGYSVFITSSEFDRGRERRNLEAFLNRCVDGVIINRTANQHDDLIQKLVDLGIHVIIEGEMGPVRFPLVTIDEFKLAELAAEHMWALGHRQILYFSAEDVRDESRPIHYYRRENFLVPWNRISGNLGVREFRTADPVNGGNDLAEYLASVRAEDRPTAVVCSTDRLALSLISGLRVHRIRVPEDISVLGCDDIPAAGEATVPLTTIRQPVEKVGEAIWALLEKKLREAPGVKPEETPAAIYIQPELIVRESTRAISTSFSP
jgi:DNA-binding LacI/PurR family transcriptional regulator